MADIYDMTDTWNDAGTTFTAVKMNVTDTASNSASLLLDLQVGGASKFQVKKSGNISISGNGIEASGNTLYFTGGGTFCFGTGANLGAWVDSTDYIAWTSGSIFSARDTLLYRDGAGILALRNSTNAQEFRAYNTYTDASNYERGFLKWNSNVLEVGTEAAGTGTQRDVQLNGANRASHITDVSSGTDTAYETAINAIIAALESHGIAATS